MPVTQKDIAREAGVSQTVVSDVLQGNTRSRVSTETRGRILAAARKLSYRPNASAQALRSRRSRQIAYLTTRRDADANDALGEQILGAAARALSEAGYRMVLEVASERGGEAGRLEEMLGAGVCDGCIVRSFEDSPELCRELRRLGAPVVVVGQMSDPEITSVAHDVNGMVEKTLAHLKARGHQRIGTIANPRNTRYHQLYEAAWQAGDGTGVDLHTFRFETTDRWEAEAAVASWLRATEPPTAVVCHNQRVGLGASAAIRAAGRRLGTDLDLFLMTTQGADWACDPGAWVLRADTERVGRQAAEELLRLLNGAPSGGPIRLLPEILQL
jgi:LacI family transcriptional regulator